MPTPEYDEAVTAAKLKWLEIHLHSVKWDAINIVAYGTPKHSFKKTKEDIIFDDDKNNREAWIGEAYEPSQIMGVLKALAKGE